MMNFLTEGLEYLVKQTELAPTIIKAKAEESKIERDAATNESSNTDISNFGTCRIPISSYGINLQYGGIRNDYITKQKRKVEMIKYGLDDQLINEAEAIDYDDEEAQFDDIYDKAVRANSASFLNTVASDLHDEVMDVVNHMSNSAKRDFEYVTACIQVAVNKTSAVGKFSEKRKKELIDDIEEIKKHLGESEYKPYVEILLNQSKALISKIEDLILKQNVDSQEPEEDTSAKATDKNDAD